MAELLSVVLITGLVSGAAPMNAYAEENAETENVTGSDPLDETESETTDITGKLPEGAAGETEKDPAEEPAEGMTTDPAEEPTEEEDRSGDAAEDTEENDALPEDETALAEEETALMEEDIAGDAVLLADHIHNGITFEPWTGTESLPAGGNWYLTENVTLSAGGWNAPDGTTRLCLNGKTITLAENGGATSPVINIGKNSQFELYDDVGGGKITGGTGSGIRNEGTFFMYGGAITGNRSSISGGGIFNIGTFFMHWGEISENSAFTGGGVYTSGVFHMFDGKIGNNHARNGGGVHNRVEFVMYGGRITKNDDDGYYTAEAQHVTAGGGVYNETTYATFDILGGEISENVAYSGGGILNSSGTINMNGGKITDNYARSSGGGVDNGGTFNLSNGEITRNRSGRGGGVQNSKTLKMFGGEITENKGGGIGNAVGNDVMSTITVGGNVRITNNKDIFGNSENVRLLFEYPHASVTMSTIITVDNNKPLSENANIGITIESFQMLPEGSAISVTSSNGADYSTYFHSDNPDYSIRNGTDNAVLLYIPVSHTHQWETVWSNNEACHWHNCTAIGCTITDNAAKDGYAAHTEDGGTVTKEPTETEEGIRTYKCSICGYVVRTETIPAIGTGGDKPDDGNDDKPDNGGGEEHPDDNNEPNDNPPENNNDGGNNNVSDNHNIVSADSESVDVSQDVIDTDTANGGELVFDTETPVMIPEQPKDPEPKTADATPVELYATLAMISGLTYVILYFADRNGGMTEKTKKELVSKLIRWAKRGKTLRRLLALSAIFALLVYYHSIGKQGGIEWKEAC